MKFITFIGFGGIALLLAGCSATLPIRPTSFFLLQNDRMEEPVEPQKPFTEPAQPAMPDEDTEELTFPS